MATYSRISPGQLISSIGAILILAAGAGSYFFLAPRLQVAQNAQNQAEANLKAVNGEISELKDDQVKLQALKRKLADQDIDITRIQLVLPVTEQLPSLYIQMESILGMSPGLVNPTYTLGNPVKGLVFGADIPVTFSAGGTYPQLKELLTKLEQNIRPISFTQISISTSTVGKAGAAGAQADPKKVVAPVTLTASGFVRAQSLSSAFVKQSTTK